jgi:uncharacterized protein (DUF1684 family)
LILVFIFSLFNCCAQEKGYKDSIRSYIKEYIETHEVVTGKDRQYLDFYPVDEKFRVFGKFEFIKNSPWFKMETSGAEKKLFRVYGKVRFSINDTIVSLNIYQSQSLMGTEKYRDHLFIPFMDLTSGEETYTSGRYLDLNTNDVKNHELVIDFNKAYNPYCAYVSNRYNCPIPPRENHLNVAIIAGEKLFGKK